MPKRSAGQPIRVFVAEFSRTQCELLADLVRADGMIVVGTASDGPAAIAAVRRLRPDVIVMDINLPGVDGYAATRQIMQDCPTPIVLTSSTWDTSKGHERALAAGALTMIRTPGGAEQAADRANFVTTLRLMADVLVVTRYPERTLSAEWAAEVNARQRTPLADRPRLATAPSAAPQILAIAASTGGPSAAQTLLSRLGTNFPLPILVAQHIARGFVAPLVDWLNATISLPVHIVQPNERLLPGHVYLAPDDQHLNVFARDHVANRAIHATDRYCPSADILFETVAAVYGPRAIGVILTGMGDDGARGLRTLRMAGGRTLAQDEASCVVYGMPRVAAELGAVEYVAPPAELAQMICDLIGISA